MTNPFGRSPLDGDITSSMTGFLQDAVDAGAENLRLTRQIRAMTQWNRQPAYVVPPVPPAELSAEDTHLRSINPRDGSELGIRDQSLFPKISGETSAAEDDPRIASPTRTVQTRTEVGGHTGDRTWYEKVDRVFGLSTGLRIRSPEELRAVDYERQQQQAGLLDGLIESTSTVVGQAFNVMGSEVGAKLFPVLGLLRNSVGERLFKKTQEARIAIAQTAMNSTEQFKRSAQQQAIEDGVSGEDIEEANVWGRNSGYLVGMIPVAAATEQALASTMTGLVTGMGARGLMASSLMRHTLASAGANMALTPIGSPILPDFDEAEKAAQQAVDQPSWDAAQNMAFESAKLFAQPSYAGAGVLGGVLGLGFGAAGAWWAQRAARAFRVGEGVMTGDVSTFATPEQIESGYVYGRKSSGSSREVYGTYYMDDSPTAPPEQIESGYVYGQKSRNNSREVSGTFYVDDNSPRPIAGLLSDGRTSTTEISGVDASVPSSVDAPVGAEWKPRSKRKGKLKATNEANQPTLDEMVTVNNALVDMGAAAPDTDVMVAIAGVEPPSLLPPEPVIEAIPLPELVDTSPFNLSSFDINAPAVIQPEPVSSPFSNALVEELSTPEKLVQQLGMEPEAAAMISQPTVSLPSPERASITPPNGLMLAKKFGSVLTDPSGDPMIAFGVGDVNQVMTLSENGNQSLFAGRANVIYLTNEAADVGGTTRGAMQPAEIDGGLYPAQLGNEKVAAVTLQAQQAAGAVEQARTTIGELRRQLAVSGQNSNLAASLRGQIAELETVISRQTRPVSAVTPFYVVSRNSLDLNLPVSRDAILNPPELRSAQDNMLMEALATTVKLNDKTLPIINQVMEQIQGGLYDTELGTRALYNDLAFKLFGEKASAKGTIINRSLQAIGVDTIHSDIVPGVSQGNSQIGTKGSRMVAVLDPRALVPVYAADEAVEEGLARLHAQTVTRAEQVTAAPARSDLPKIKTIGDIDFVGSRLLIDQYEHVMVRRPQNPLELMQMARQDHPQYSVQAVEGPHGQLDVYVGSKPLTAEAIEQYKATGYHAGQRVKDMGAGGMERTVYTVDFGGKKPKLVLFPLESGPIRPGVQITDALRKRFIPGTSNAPMIDNIGSQWDDFQQMAATYIGDLNNAGKTQVTSLLDPDARELLPAILQDYFDLTGVRNQLHKNALESAFKQKIVEQFRNMNPELANWWRSARADVIDAVDDMPPSLDDVANARGAYVAYAPGSSDVFVTKNSTAEVQRFGNAEEARAYLEDYEPQESVVEVESNAPAEVAGGPSVEGTPAGRSQQLNELDPYDNTDTIEQDLDDTLQVGTATDAAYGATPPQQPGSWNLGPGGTQGTTQQVSSYLKAFRVVLDKPLGWLKPSHAFFADLEQVLANTKTATSDGLSFLRPYADIEGLKLKQQMALERGNSAYVAIEAVRRQAPVKALRDGHVWRMLSMPTQNQRFTYALANKLPANTMNTVAALDDAVTKAFGSLPERQKHWQNVLDYVDAVGTLQRRNRAAPTAVYADIYDKAAVGLSDIEWLVGHSKNVNFSAETVNAVDFLGSMTHSYNYHKYVKTDANAVKDVWRQIGNIAVTKIDGSEFKPLQAHAAEVTDWIQLLETGHIANSSDPVVDFMAGASKKAGYPLTKGEVKSLVAMGLGNTTKAFMGWSSFAVVRDFLQLTMTVPFTGPEAVGRAVKNMTGSRQAATLARLRRLGLASSQNELQNASGLVDPLTGAGLEASMFTPEEVIRRQRVQEAATRIADAVPQWMKNFRDAGMGVYSRSNTLSRSLSAEAALQKFDMELTKVSVGGTAADRVTAYSANPKLYAEMLDAMSVAPKPTRRLIIDKLNAGLDEEAAAEYAQHIVMSTQGGYGPLHAGKLWRTVGGRMAGQFQNYTMNLYNVLKQTGGVGKDGGIESWYHRARLAGGVALAVGGTDYAAHKIREHYGIDLTSYSPGHGLFHSVPYTGFLQTPVLDAARNDLSALTGLVSKSSDYPQRQGSSGRGLVDFVGNAALPYRNISKAVGATVDATQSAEGPLDFLNYMMSGKSNGPHFFEDFDRARQHQQQSDDLLQQVLSNSHNGNGAQ